MMGLISSMFPIRNLCHRFVRTNYTAVTVAKLCDRIVAVAQHVDHWHYSETHNITHILKLCPHC